MKIELPGWQDLKHEVMQRTCDIGVILLWKSKSGSHCQRVRLVPIAKEQGWFQLSKSKLPMSKSKAGFQCQRARLVPNVKSKAG